MTTLVADLETDGLLDSVTRLHCLAIGEADGGPITPYCDQKGYAPLSEGLNRLSEAAVTVWHNGVKFDVPVLQKLYPRLKLRGRVTDTLILTRLMFPNVLESDSAAPPHKRLANKLFGSHKLEAWGHRLGVMKGEYTGGWEGWNQEMMDYNVQDVAVTCALLHHCNAQGYSEQAISIEHEFAEIIARQERHGFAFDEARAHALYARLVKRRLELSSELKANFPPWFAPAGVFTPKKDNKRLGYVAGAPVTKIARTEFNASSRHHIADRLKKLRGWEPTEYTPSGQPKIDETILEKLPWGEAKVLAEHFLVEKRIGQLAEGDQAWLKLVRNGAIHGSVNTNGAVTGRCTHSNPNVSQTPKVGSPYGEECRSLYHARKGFLLVGVDLASVELRCLSHFMARWDDGAYGLAVVEGKEEDGTDVHSLNCKALGMDPKTVYVVLGKTQKGRNCAKTFIYAFLYGAGDEKIGTIVGVSDEEIKQFPYKHPKAWESAKKRLRKAGRTPTPLTCGLIVKGGLLKAEFLKMTPALASLRQAVEATAKKRGHLIGLDGRRLHVRSAHAALNTLLQSAGALLAKVATILAIQELNSRGYRWGKDYALVCHCHDELQLEAREDIADEVGHIVVEAMRKAGEFFKFRVPIDGTAKIGRTWADTH
jgi:DNA polymerase-1